MRKLPTDRAELEMLHLGDCFGLLGSVPVGRIGLLAGGGVVILPVNFLVDGQDVVFRTAAGSKLPSIEVGHFVASRPTPTIRIQKPAGRCWSAGSRRSWTTRRPPRGSTHST